MLGGKPCQSESGTRQTCAQPTLKGQTDCQRVELLEGMSFHLARAPLIAVVRSFSLRGSGDS